MEVPSFHLHSILIILGHRVGVEGKGVGRRKRTERELFFLSKKYLLLSLRTKKTLVLREVNNDLSVLLRIELKKFMESLCVGSSLLTGKT